MYHKRSEEWLLGVRRYVGELLVMLCAVVGCIASYGADNLDHGIPGPADQIINREGYALVAKDKVLAELAAEKVAAEEKASG